MIRVGGGLVPMTTILVQGTPAELVVPAEPGALTAPVLEFGNSDALAAVVTHPLALVGGAWEVTLTVAQVAALAAMDSARLVDGGEFIAAGPIEHNRGWSGNVSATSGIRLFDARTLASLTDVDLTGAATGDMLTLAADGKWKPTSPALLIQLASRGESVRAHGAVGDGVADDTAAFQAAHDALAAQGGGVVVDDGVYRVKGVTISKPQVVVSGPGHIVDTTGTGDLFVVTGTGATFRDLIMWANGPTEATITSGQSRAVRFQAGNDHVVTGCKFQAFWRILDFENCGGWKITDCNFDAPSDAAVVQANAAFPDGGDTSIQGCLFKGSRASAAQVRHVSGGGLKISNTKFLGNGTDRAIDCVVPNGVDTSILQVSNCSIEHPKVSAIRVTQGGAPGSATGKFFRTLITGVQITHNVGTGAAIDIVGVGTAATDVGYVNVTGCSIYGAKYASNPAAGLIRVVNATYGQIVGNQLTAAARGLEVPTGLQWSWAHYANQFFDVTTTGTW